MGSLGKVKVDDVIRIPLAVRRFFDLEEGDYLEFWPSIDALAKYMTKNKVKNVNCITVQIVRKGKKK